ncbi:EmrB/QacA subfamily drug resistance transporter [Rhizobium sp. WW_1]|nr:EmrB/QacA subfamily drug resistance transporter [Rhizobium sp. WW_1]
MKPIPEKPGEAAHMQTATSARWALASLSLSMLMPSLDTSIANVGLPTLAQAFGASFQQVQWIVLAYLLSITTLIVSVGRLGDIFGRRRLLLTGIALFTLASLFCGLAPTLPLLIAARALQGLGAAMMMALTVAMVGEAVPKERTGSAMGLLGTMSAIGTTLGPSLGGILIASLGWETIFLVNVPLGIVNFLLAARFLPADRQDRNAARGRLDGIGTLLLALTLAAYALAMTMGHGSFGVVNIGLLLAAAFGIALFVFAETKVKSPLLHLSMFRNRKLSMGLAMSTLVSTVIMATLVVGPFYLSLALGFDAAHVGAIMSAGPLVSALTGVPAGHIVDRFGAHRMSMVGLVGMIVGLSLIAALQGRFGAAGYIGPLVITTANYALFQASNNTSIMKGIRAEQRGVISGMLSLSRNLGLVTGASVMGAIFALASGTTDMITARPEAVGTGMQITYVVGALLIVATLAVALTGQAFAKRTVLSEETP